MPRGNKKNLEKNTKKGGEEKERIVPGVSTWKGPVTGGVIGKKNVGGDETTSRNGGEGEEGGGTPYGLIRGKRYLWKMAGRTMKKKKIGRLPSQDVLTRLHEHEQRNSEMGGEKG